MLASLDGWVCVVAAARRVGRQHGRQRDPLVQEEGASHDLEIGVVPLRRHRSRRHQEAILGSVRSGHGDDLARSLLFLRVCLFFRRFLFLEDSIARPPKIGENQARPVLVYGDTGCTSRSLRPNHAREAGEVVDRVGDLEAAVGAQEGLSLIHISEPTRPY